MKKLTTAILLILTLLLACGLAACDKGEGGGGFFKDYTLEGPITIKYNGEAITWNAVENAEYYLVSINGGEERKITSPLFIYNAMQQSFTVKVTAKNEKNELSAEDTFQPLGQITEISVDENGRLTWNTVDYATGYAVRIDNAQDPIVVSTNYMDLTEVGKHTYEVKPVMQNDDHYFSSYSEKKTVTILEQVAGDSITYSQGYIVWDYVSGAVAYEIAINGTVIDSVNTTKLLYDPMGADFDVTVKAVGNHVDVFDGAASEPKSFIFLDPVTGVKIVDGILVWDPVEKATGYRLKLNGREISETMVETKYTGLTEGVTTEVQIMPLSADAATFSNWSPAISVYLMPAPVLQWNTGYHMGDSQTASIFWNWDDTQAVTGFTVKVIDPNGGETITNLPGTQRSFADPYLLAGDYKVSVQANSAESNVYSSKFSKEITVRRLATPGNNVQKFIESDANDISKGFTVTFERVFNASKYYLYQDGNKIRETADQLQFKVQNFHDPDAVNGQTLNFKIVAVGSNMLVNGVVTLDSLMDNALSFTITVLPAPTVIGMEGFNLAYTGVTGNNGYRVTAGAKVYDSTATTCSLTELEAGGYDVTVCTKGDGRFILPSIKTPSIRVERLDAPTNIRIDTSEASEGVITYSPVLYASGYYIIFNNSGNPVPVDTIDNINQYITEQGTTVHMYSSANYYNNDRTVYYMESKGSETMNFIKLAAPTFGDVKFTNTELLWNPSANVNLNVYTPTYQVYLADGTVLNGEKNGTRMDISMLEGGQSYTFMIKAIGDGKTYINSDTSIAVSIYKLSTPKVERVGNTYTWKGVPNAVNYMVYVDGVLDSTEIHVSGTTYTYVPSKFTELKDYKVQVYAIGDQGYTSLNSKPCEIVQKVKQLVTPEISFSYDHDSYTKDGKIVVNVTKPSPYATAYTYTVGSTHTGATSADTTFSICPNSTGEYEIRVFAVGGGFDEEGTYYIDSQSVGGNARYKITLLASPNPTDMTLNRDGLLTWPVIKGATGYSVTVLKDGAVVEDATRCTGTTCEISDFELGHTYTVEIQALGNGTNIIASETVTREWIVNP